MLFWVCTKEPFPYLSQALEVERPPPFTRVSSLPLLPKVSRECSVCVYVCYDYPIDMS